jgi:hypothetical protein
VAADQPDDVITATINAISLSLYICSYLNPTLNSTTEMKRAAPN